MLKELTRISIQHRTLYCYVILSIWIFLLIAGMYKYIGSIERNNNKFLTIQGFGYQKTKEYFKDDEEFTSSLISNTNHSECTHPSMLMAGEEGGSLEGWTLQGVLLLVRHGDRGPMAHVRGINGVDCGYENDPSLDRYVNFVQNSTTSTSTSGHWMKTGPFHGFPLLPATTKLCMLAQLTPKGIAQMLRVGNIVRQKYARLLGLYKQYPSNGLTKNTRLNGTDNNTKQTTIGNLYNVDDVVVYSTRYRRTFQSGMALLFAALPHEKWLGLNIQESHSLSYCFSDCACPQAEKLKKSLASEMSRHLAQHPTIGAITQWIGATILQNPQSSPGQINPLDVRDALLSHICHAAPLPCRNSREAKSRQSSSTADPSTFDLINIDLEENNAVGTASYSHFNNEQTDNPVERQTSNVEGCVEKAHVTTLMSYIHWAAVKELYSQTMRQQGLLRSYGLLRNIVSYMLKMISGDLVKLVLYSAHDKTIEYLIVSLGVRLEDPFVPYATRMAFEVYKSEKDIQYYFRLVYNGRDITNAINVCASGKSLSVPRGNRGGRGLLCPIENIIRFIHDDYFHSLNATNYKDACIIKQEM
ncbi:2-phosphoxylose phosphatase 1-like [Anopheles albimanus]|uniref:2-phosphoxylose phosphatase 1 n=1 Tax=Anopheles albimanus TaxID=7167 RepID=A0A182FMS5_ANOAL|nr:2-phosphoxylose phosphatase 1-like [Anopheles albimanus]